MIPKIMVVPDDVVIYLRFKNQTNEIPTILRKSEVKKIINNLKEKMNRVPDKIFTNKGEY